MNKLIRIGAILFIAFGAVFSLTASSVTTGTTNQDTSTSTSVVTETGDNVVDDPSLLAQLGPPGVIVTTVIGGIMMVMRAINEGKKIDVTTYKERAAEAETRANGEIGKVHKKLSELEDKLDEVIRDRDDYRDTLEARKAHFTSQVLAIEKRHQTELEEMHDALMLEVHLRHSLERVLAENGITVPLSTDNSPQG